MNRSNAKEVLIQALQEAGGLIKRTLNTRQARVIGRKNPISLVTQVDLAAEAKIHKRIHHAFPDHIFLAEEGFPHAREGEACWIVDPLDGTTNFAHGVPHACVSIAYEERGRVVLAGVYDPFREELFWAEQGGGAFLNNTRIHVSRIKSLQEAMLATGFAYDRKERAGFYLSFYEDFMKRTTGIRRFGSAALDLAWVACGRYDGFWEFNLSPWDVAAGALLVEEAGGRVSDFRGESYNIHTPIQTLASNRHIHPAMLKTLKHRLKS